MDRPDHTNPIDYRAYKAPRRRRLITTLYLLLFGICVGMFLSTFVSPRLRGGDATPPPSGTARSRTSGPTERETESAVIDAVQTAMPAVVTVQITGTQTFYQRFRDPMFDMFYGPQLRRRNISGLGSGVIVDPGGIIITNDHVVNVGGAGQTDLSIAVILSDGRAFPARVVRTFTKQDLAILAIDAEDLPSLTLGSSSSVMPGQTVLAIGNPFGTQVTDGLIGGEPTVTRGIISATRRNLTIPYNNDTYFYRNMLQTDAAINEGNSGGALVDLDGRLIGINAAIFQGGGGGSIGIGFAIPSDRVKLILDSMKQYGGIGRPYTGLTIQDLTPAIIKSLGYPGAGGAMVSSVEDGSPGSVSGLTYGDIISKVNGFTMNTAEEVISMFQGSVPGETFTITIFRDRQASEARLTVGSLEVGR